MNKAVFTLKIDPEFKNLIRPLTRKEYMQLEENLLQDGCRDPLITWNGLLLDGHNRYEICTRHQIPFAVIEKYFERREEAIGWICANQLGRRNISEETRKYLIGKRYEAAKSVTAAKAEAAASNPDVSGLGSPFDPEPRVRLPSRHRTAQIIADENHISYGSVQKYAAYARALEAIGEKVPELVPQVLSGRYKISHNNLLELATLKPSQIRKVFERLERNSQQFVQYKKTRSEIRHTSAELQEEQKKAGPSIKDTPTFDPDSEINSLALTLPTWISSIERAWDRTIMKDTSDGARRRLSNELKRLSTLIAKLLDCMEE